MKKTSLCASVGSGRGSCAFSRRVSLTHFLSPRHNSPRQIEPSNPASRRIVVRAALVKGSLVSAKGKLFYCVGEG